MTSLNKTPEEIWGPQAQPIHTSVPEGDYTAPYRDNSYFTCFDPEQKAFLEIHVMSTPNGEPHVRACAHIDGAEVVIFEPLEQPKGDNQFVYRSEHIEFDVRGKTQVKHPDLTWDFNMTPHWDTIVDWGTFMPPAGGPPHQHFDRTIKLIGPCTIKGKKYDINAVGHRDRALGFRDESTNWREYCWIYAVFPDYTVSALRLLSADGTDLTGGYVNNDSEMRKIVSMGVVRDAAGLLSEGIIGLENGEELIIESEGREAGFWIPMGWKRQGPTLSAYHEYCGVQRGDGTKGFGNFEHAIVRMIY